MELSNPKIKNTSWGNFPSLENKEKIKKIELSLIFQQGPSKAWKTKISYNSGNRTPKEEVSYICQKKLKFLNQNGFLWLLKGKKKNNNKEFIQKSTYSGVSF